MNDIGQELVKAAELRPPSPIEQKVRDTFGDYPQETQTAISQLLEQQKVNWQKHRENPNDLVAQTAAESGITYTPSKSVAEIPRRGLTEEESLKYKEFEELITPLRRSKTYGFPLEGPTSRFYISLKDSAETAGMMRDLTNRFLAMHGEGALPFFQFKIEGRDEGGNIRFDPSYVDKGASVILYLPDDKLAEIDEVLNGILTEHPDAFLPQEAQFKYSPKGVVAPWHAAMEATGVSEPLSTPEQGMRKASQQFLTNIGLTSSWEPIQSLDPVKVRGAWESATSEVGRNPQKPYITTDRPTPSYFT